MASAAVRAPAAATARLLLQRAGGLVPRALPAFGLRSNVGLSGAAQSSASPVASSAPPSSPCKLVVFDKDGTLLDDAATWSPLLEALGDTLEGYTPRRELFDVLGYCSDNRHFVPGSFVMTATNDEIEVRIAENWGSEAGKGFRDYIDGLSTDHAKGVSIAPLRPLMTELRESGVQVAMLTSDTRRFTNAFLEHHGIADLVTTIVCGDDGLEPKPSAQPLHTICERLGVSPDEAAMVGDSSERDVGSGLAANFGHVIGVTSGIDSAEHHQAAGAHAVVGSVAEIPRVLRERYSAAAVTAAWVE